MKIRLVYPVVLTIALIFMVFVTGCEGGFNVKFTVYEQVNPPENAVGSVYIEKALPKDIAVTPLQFASISVWGKNNPDGQKSSIKNYTNAEGKCGLNFMNYPPGKYIVEIKKDNYQVIQGEFEIKEENCYPRYNHFINAILAKELTP